jgi:hypothetical protein
MRYESKPITDAEKHGRPINVVTSIRWLPYKKASEQYRKGIKGRWQVATEYGWENIRGDEPTYHLVPFAAE